MTTALWSSDRTGNPVRVRTRKPVTVVDMLGSERVLEPVDGWVHLTATGAPVCLRAAVDKVEEPPLLSLSAPRDIAAGAEVPVTATLDNRVTGHSDGASVRERTVVFEIEGERVTVSAAPGRRATAVLQVQAGDAGALSAGAADWLIRCAAPGRWATWHPAPTGHRPSVPRGDPP
ncbi:hypothetical protein [Streptomyces sp. NPDC087538]|uniref:hypothetical protein n=1 Tax=Streptomyces sp. NPDC087538 TaxID=3365797 RepID=UPI003826B4E0